MLCIYTESIIDCSKEKLRMYDIVRLLSSFRFINLIDNPSERFDNVKKDDKSFDHQSYAEFSYLFKNGWTRMLEQLGQSFGRALK